MDGKCDYCEKPAVCTWEHIVVRYPILRKEDGEWDFEGWYERLDGLDPACDSTEWLCEEHERDPFSRGG